jgi:hypothetical protein
MELTDEIKKIIPEHRELNEKEHDQLLMLEEVEKILKKLGISLETRFEIPLSSRMNSPSN